MVFHVILPMFVSNYFFVPFGFHMSWPTAILGLVLRQSMIYEKTTTDAVYAARASMKNDILGIYSLLGGQRVLTRLIAIGESSWLD